MIESAVEAKKVLNLNQIKFNQEDDGKSGVYLHFKDPDGTLLYFVEPKWK